jgi:hypothetical protein
MSWRGATGSALRCWAAAASSLSRLAARSSIPVDQHSAAVIFRVVSSNGLAKPTFSLLGEGMDRTYTQEKSLLWEYTVKKAHLRWNMKTNFKKMHLCDLKFFETWHTRNAFKYVLTCKSWDIKPFWKIHMEIINFTFMDTSRQNFKIFFLLVHIHMKFVIFLWIHRKRFCTSTFSCERIYG